MKTTLVWPTNTMKDKDKIEQKYSFAKCFFQDYERFLHRRPNSLANFYVASFKPTRNYILQTMFYEGSLWNGKKSSY